MCGRDRVVPAPEFQRGDLIAGRYSYVRQLGSGGMATLHLAIAQGPSGFAKQVVLKMPHRFGGGSESDRESVLREARLAARLEHPSIVHTFEVIEAEHSPIIVMEYLRGWALSTVRPYNADPDAPALPLAGWLRVLSDTLGALRYVHQLRDFDGRSAGLVHRDVSPQNIFITDEGYVKLLDFGAATVLREAAGSEPCAGKLRYMPREQLLGEGVDGRVDLYAVGGLLWEALSGERLWRDLDLELVRARILLGKLPPREAPAIPELFRGVIARAIAPRDARYPTADELDRAILDAAGGEHALWSHAALREWMIDSSIPCPDDLSVDGHGCPAKSDSGVALPSPTPSSTGRERVMYSARVAPSEEHSRTERLDPQSVQALSSVKSPRRPAGSKIAGRSSWLFAALAGLLVAGVAIALTWGARQESERHTSGSVIRSPGSMAPRLPSVEPGVPTDPSVAAQPGAGEIAASGPRRSAAGINWRSDGSAARSPSRTGEQRERAVVEPDPASVMPNGPTRQAPKGDCAYLDADGIKRYRSGCLVP